MFFLPVWQFIASSPAQLQIESVTSQPIWTQLFTALIIGLFTAFALQFLLTSLGIAVGLSMVQLRSSQPASVQQSGSLDSDSLDSDLIESDATELDQAKPKSGFATVSRLAGTGILLTLNFVLFAACFLATKATEVNTPLLGGITGIVIWSAYFLLLLWLSSSAVSSLAGTLFDTATGGLRRLISLITAIGQNQEDSEPLTEAEVMAAVRQEMQAMFNQVNWQAFAAEKMQLLVPVIQQGRSDVEEEDIAVESTPISASSTQTIRAEMQQKIIQKLASYLLESSPKKLTAKRMQYKFDKLLQKASAQLADDPLLVDLLPNLTCIEVQNLLAQRQDLTNKQKQQIGKQAEQLWRQATQNYYQQLEPAVSSEVVEVENTKSSGLLPQLAASLLPLEEDISIDQAMATLTEKLQRLEQVLPWSEIAPKLLPLVLPRIYQSLKVNMPTANSLDLPDYAALEPGQILKELQPGLNKLNRSMVQQLETVIDQLVQQAESVQQTVKNRMTTLKQQTQRQIAATRKAATIAAWWLFAITLTSLISSALAGALAAHPPDLSYFLPQL